MIDCNLNWTHGNGPSKDMIHKLRERLMTFTGSYEKLGDACMMSAALMVCIMVNIAGDAIDSFVPADPEDERRIKTTMIDLVKIANKDGVIVMGLAWTNLCCLLHVATEEKIAFPDGFMTSVWKMKARIDNMVAEGVKAN